MIAEEIGKYLELNDFHWSNYVDLVFDGVICLSDMYGYRLADYPNKNKWRFSLKLTSGYLYSSFVIS